MLVEHFERVKLFGLLVSDKQDAAERSGTERALALEIF